MVFNRRLLRAVAVTVISLSFVLCQQSFAKVSLELKTGTSLAEVDLSLYEEICVRGYEESYAPFLEILKYPTLRAYGEMVFQGVSDPIKKDPENVFLVSAIEDELHDQLLEPV